MKLERPIERWSARAYNDATDTLHRDIFCSAIMLLEEGHTNEQTFDIMREAANAVDERHVPDRELHSAINCAASYITGGLALEGVRWPAPEPAFLSEVIKNNLPLAGEIIEQARVRPNMVMGDTLRAVYPPKSLLCVAFASAVFATGTVAEIETWSHTRTVEYLTPNPMSRVEGTTKEGKSSAHCEDNTGPKVFQVIEFDKGDPRNHVACHIHLARMLPLMMLVYSGGKSVHGWFKIQPDSDVKAFFYEACMLGADQVMWSKCQFSRMPNGRNNKTGRLQKILYFDPKHTLLT